jgi:hypothetical protein
MAKKSNVIKIGKQILGGTLIILGIAGLFLPFMQGIAFIIAGTILLGNKQLLDFFKKILKKFKK